MSVALRKDKEVPVIITNFAPKRRLATAHTMTAADLTNIFLRLQMAGKEGESDFLFDAGRRADAPFAITGIYLDDDGDICLESDERARKHLSASEIAEAVSSFDPGKTIYFVTIDKNGNGDLYNIKDGGTYDRHSPELRPVRACDLNDLLKTVDPTATFHLESGTINFTINAIYTDDEGCLILESNEIEELADYTADLVMEELSQCPPDTKVIFLDDEASEYYGLYLEEHRTDESGDLWVKAR